MSSPAPALNPSPGLFAEINQISLFGEIVDLKAFTPGKPAIVGYLGQPLFVTDFSLAGTVLVLKIDDQGPPASPPASFTTAPTAAQAELSVGGSAPFESVPTTKAPAYAGGAYIITATLDQDPVTFKSAVIPTVGVWTAPPNDPNFADLAFVLVKVPGQLTQLQWLAQEVPLTAVPGNAQVIPPAKGGGTLGPFGIETP
jgi:hypothetical protein